MSSLPEILNEVDYAAVTTGCITVVLTLLSLDAPHWERTVAARARDHEIRVTLVDRFYTKRPLGLYELVPHLALRTSIKRRPDRYQLRANKAAELPEPLRTNAMLLARKWLETIGTFAEEAAWRKVDLRPFLSTYHLGVVREGVIAVPIAISMMARNELSSEEIDQLSHGFTLVELAAKYNSRARQQREPIYFVAKSHDEPPVGPVLRAPGKWERRLYDVLERFDRPLRIRGRRRRERWLRGIEVGPLTP